MLSTYVRCLLTSKQRHTSTSVRQGLIDVVYMLSDVATLFQPIFDVGVHAGTVLSAGVGGGTPTQRGQHCMVRCSTSQLFLAGR